MGVLFQSKVAQDPAYYAKKRAAEKDAGRKLTNSEFEDLYMKEENKGTLSSTGTSIFDPVLCETQYLWFTKKGDKIIDPFSGGSVRGIVAVETGRSYVGVDLRQEQIDANIANASICTNEKPTWICGDSQNIDVLANGKYDFMFTCPPYGNLEKYSDDPNDLSNMDDSDFDEIYREILHKTVGMLNNDRFASIVVGNYRNKEGILRDLVGLTVRAMEEAGAHYYNDFIYVTPCGSLPIRIGKQFRSSRKAGKTHQYCLNFIKGDSKKATERLGEVEIPDLDEYFEGDDD